MRKLDPALQDYASIIEKLKPVSKSEDLDSVLNSIASDIPKPKRFLIKMELKRLSSPCKIRLDLRGHVDGICREYDYQGITHYLDDVGVKKFEKGIKIFGLYSTGVYEDVLNAENNYRVMQQRQKNPSRPLKASTFTEEATSSVQYPAKAVLFGNRGVRVEERMIYAIAVDIELGISTIVRAVTTDLSVSGCRLKINDKYPLEKKQLIYLQYTGLEKDFALGLKDKIQYEVVGIEKKQGFIYARCKRTYDVTTDSFDDFLDNFINGNKRRYKLNLDNTVDAVITKGYEQFYLPRINSLPIFINENEQGEYNAAMMLSNDNNKHIIRHWLNESNVNCLGQLLTDKRIKDLKQKPGRIKEGLLYCFTHIAKGRIFFYSATIDELNQSPELKTLYLGFGANKPNWMVYKIQLIDIDPNLSFLPLTLPDNASEEAKKWNKPPSARVMKHISQLRYVALLSDFSDEEGQNAYKNTEIDLSQVNKLQVFGHSKSEEIPLVEDIAIKYVNLRSETRFIYKTQVVISSDLFDKTGITRDFSSSGMQIEFPESLNLEKSKIIKIALPELQKISSKFKLKNLEYEVVGLNKAKTVVNLRLYEQRGTNHIGKQFFDELIDKNISRLKTTNLGHVIPGLAEALRNIYAQRVLNTGFFVHKQGIRHDLKTIGYSHIPNPVVDLLSTESSETEHSLYILLRQNYLNSFIINMLRRLQRHSKPLYQDLYVRCKLSESNEKDRFESILAHEIRNEAARKIFIQKSIQPKMMFFSLRVYLSRTGRPDTEFIAKELAYVSQYAIHKAKSLEEELWSVTGVGDIIDNTEETMTRFNFPADKIEQQLKLRHEHS
ncbi:PilZ domain-containing protein [Catenovulum maritimum]|uniref:PilZ domain-containing protein n=1 Tax=Catenovulum maritimum TaxID=1513271 RepID=A0A0J8JL30_9ALTE|nr:PilZ domain-containing protein [Catenovulum maritimum]KMT65261.1 hypothetical protein XM47_09475 [Catenovulum maritimum]